MTTTFYFYFIASFITVGTAAALYFFKRPYSVFMGAAITAVAVSSATLFFSAYSCLAFCSALFPNKFVTFIVMATALPGVILFFYQMFANPSAEVWVAPLAALFAIRLTSPAILNFLFDVRDVPVFVAVVSLLLFVAGVLLLNATRTVLLRVVAFIAVVFSLAVIFIMFSGNVVVFSVLVLLSVAAHWLVPVLRKRKYVLPVKEEVVSTKVF